MGSQSNSFSVWVVRSFGGWVKFQHSRSSISPRKMQSSAELSRTSSPVHMFWLVLKMFLAELLHFMPELFGVTPELFVLCWNVFVCGSQRLSKGVPNAHFVHYPLQPVPNIQWSIILYVPVWTDEKECTIILQFVIILNRIRGSRHNLYIFSQHNV